MKAPRALVVAKAPVAGRVKTRLGADIGHDAAADVAASALLDTIDACTEAFGADGCLLALAGDLADAVRGAEIAAALTGWAQGTQRGATFAARLANAHADVPTGGPVVQVGMDTPQLSAEHLHEVARGLESHDAVLGPALDGGWWVLGLRRPRGAAALHDVPMSTPTTYADTRRALRGAGLEVGATVVLRDVDTVEDARAVARETQGAFARTWRGIDR